MSLLAQLASFRQCVPLLSPEYRHAPYQPSASASVSRSLSLAAAASLLGILAASPALSQTAAASAEAASTPQASASAARPAAAPNFQGALQVNAINPEDLLDHNKTVLIPTVYVTLLTGGRQTAVKHPGLFQQGNNTARASLTYETVGLDAPFTQSIAQRAYQDAVDRLRAAGFTVITSEDVKGTEVMQATEREAQAVNTKTEHGLNWLVATPSAEQNFKAGFGGSLRGQFAGGRGSKVDNATVIIPTYTIVAPQVWADGSQGYSSVSAGVNTAPGMNLQSAYAYWMGTPRSRMMRGAPGLTTRAQVINISTNVGEFKQTANTTPTAANATSFGLSTLLGGGQIQQASATTQFQLNKERYTSAAMSIIGRFNSELAEAAREAKL